MNKFIKMMSSAANSIRISEFSRIKGAAISSSKNDIFFKFGILIKLKIDILAFNWDVSYQYKGSWSSVDDAAQSHINIRKI